MIITNESIDSALHSLVAESQSRCPVFFPFFSLMYNTGARAVEVISRERWSCLGDDYIMLVTAKKNDDRMFRKSSLPVEFIALLEVDNNERLFPTYQQLSYCFRNLFIYHSVFIGQKRSSLHLFRHNYAKNLISKKYTVEEVQDALGERKKDSALSYIDSVYRLQPYSL